MLLRWLIVTSFSWALFSCSNIKAGGNTYDLSGLDHTILATSEADTPPSITNSTVYINPCGPVDVKECANDAQVCLVERVKLDKKVIVTKVVNVVSEELGTNSTIQPGFNGEQGFDVQYSGTKWGDEEVFADISYRCSQELYVEWPSQRYFSSNVFLQISSPEICVNSGTTPPSPPKKEKSGGWGFFSWFFFLLFIGTAVYAFQFWRTNYAHDFGGGRIDFESIAELVRDVPYLVRDFLRKLADTFAGAGRSGYSAI